MDKAIKWNPSLPASLKAPSPFHHQSLMCVDLPSSLTFKSTAICKDSISDQDIQEMLGQSLI